MYKIGICDDEKSTCAELEDIIDDFFRERGEKCEIQVWYTAESLRNDMIKFRPDVLFLDIEFPTENGVSVGKFIRDDLNDQIMNIVYISHKTNYAMELFQIHPYDFLVKPIKKRQIIATISKILELEEIENKEFKYVYNREEHRIPYGSILYFSSENRRVVIHKRDGSEETYYGKLNDIANKMPFNFFVASKSYVINMKHVTMWKRDYAKMTDGTVIHISRPNRDLFENTIHKYTIRGGELI